MLNSLYTYNIRREREGEERGGGGKSIRARAGILERGGRDNKRRKNKTRRSKKRIP